MTSIGINGLSKQLLDQLKNQKSNANGNQAKANPLQVDGDVFSAAQNAPAAQVNVYSQSGALKAAQLPNASSVKNKSEAEAARNNDDSLDDITAAIRENNQLAAAQGSGLNFDKVLSLLAD
jgi:hypothetical protein